MPEVPDMPDLPEVPDVPDEEQERITITAAVGRTDWSQYAGPASAVRRRGERRRHRLQATAAVGTTFAVAGVAVAVIGLGGKGTQTAPGEKAASPTSSASPEFRMSPAAPTTSGSGATTSGTSAAGYPSFPATLPTTPRFIADPGHVLQSGVIGAGSVSGHQWQISYRVTPSGSAANSQPEVTQTDVSLDGKVVNIGAAEGSVVTGSGYETLDQWFRNSGVPNPMIVAYGGVANDITGIDLRWKNGTVVQVPIRTVGAARFASFAWDPTNPPEALEQVSARGVDKITIKRDGDNFWSYDVKSPAIAGAVPPSVTALTGTPILTEMPKVTPISSGLLGAGTAAGHPWQAAYEIVPSGSAENSSNEVFCTNTTADGKTQQGGCTSAKPFGDGQMGFSDYHSMFPFVLGIGGARPGTTSAGFEWADGTKTVNAVAMVEGRPMTALAFDPAHPPAYVIEYGSYGEYRMPLTGDTSYSWTFNWPH